MTKIRVIAGRPGATPAPSAEVVVRLVAGPRPSDPGHVTTSSSSIIDVSRHRTNAVGRLLLDLPANVDIDPRDTTDPDQVVPLTYYDIVVGPARRSIVVPAGPGPGPDGEWEWTDPALGITTPPLPWSPDALAILARADHAAGGSEAAAVRAEEARDAAQQHEAGAATAGAAAGAEAGAVAAKPFADAAAQHGDDARDARDAARAARDEAADHESDAEAWAGQAADHEDAAAESAQAAAEDRAAAVDAAGVATTQAGEAQGARDQAVASAASLASALVAIDPRAIAWDSFTRPDAADLGAATTPAGPIAWENATAMRILGGRLAPPAGGAGNSRMMAVILLGTAQVVIDVTVAPGATARSAGPVLCAVPPDADGTGGTYLHASASGGGFSLSKVVGGVATTIASAPSWSLPNNEAIRIRLSLTVIGGAVQAVAEARCRAGSRTVSGSASDAALLTATRLGVTTNHANARATNFLVTGGTL